MRVLLVTTWDTPCGIAEHSAMLRDHAEAPDLTIIPEPRWLDPTVWLREVDTTPAAGGREPGVLHLNYHAALHSRWDVAAVRAAQARGYRVVVTYHDTLSGSGDQPNSDTAKALCAAAEAFVVHEPVADLPGAHYWRQGILPAEPPLALGTPSRRPVVGTCGFDFPWKGFDLLAEASREAGWGALYVGGNLTAARLRQIEAQNPHSQVLTGFRDRRAVVSALTGCDATAFLYSCANTGQSGAVCLGIAARKPVLLAEGCRQFRCYATGPDHDAFTWTAPTVPAVAEALSRVLPHVRMHAIAARDSWVRLGARYRDLYRQVCQEPDGV